MKILIWLSPFIEYDRKLYRAGGDSGKVQRDDQKEGPSDKSQGGTQVSVDAAVAGSSDVACFPIRQTAGAKLGQNTDIVGR